MKRSVVWLAAFVLLLGRGVCAEEMSEEATSSAWGKELFAVHCAPCHGKDAKGGGPVAGALKQPPKDLTRIAEQNGGTFPDEAVEEAIDGRRTVAAHGNRAMPVWGGLFQSKAGQLGASLRLRALRIYLRSIQEKLISDPPR